jgi:hypothetical protein
VSELFICTNIINDTFTLNKSAPILKYIKLSKQDDSVVEKSFQRPEYLIVNKTYIDRIFIEFRDKELH